MAKADVTGRSINEGCMNIDFMRSLVKQYSELGQWTSALFWADAAAAAATGGGLNAASGDDVWLLASAMLARGELHRAAHAVTSRELHRRHLLCLGVAMRAYLTAREPAIAIKLMEQCDAMLLEPRNTDQTHNRALAGVLVWQARALSALERRDAAAEALASALRADCACYEALDLLLDQHALTPHQERELIESLPISSQLGAAEGAVLRAAYRERLHRYSPLPEPLPTPPADCPITAEAEIVGSRMLEAAQSKARRLTAACLWQEALKALDAVDPWCCVDVRVTCLVELKKSAQLFALAHELVDTYPNAWTSWYAVGCYYYLIGKSSMAQRYLSKAKSLEPSAGCVWLAYGHSFAADSEHDQAMAAYFKASKQMAGCHLPPLYIGVECALLKNFAMSERFLTRAATLHSNAKVVEETESGEKAKWTRVLSIVRDPHVAHEAGAAAFDDGDLLAARNLWLHVLDVAAPPDKPLAVRWAATMDALGHASRALGLLKDALRWHELALAMRPARPATLAALGLCLALLARERDAADVLHSALAKDPDDVVAAALLDTIVDRLDAHLTDEEIPQFPFPTVELSIPTTKVATKLFPSPHDDATNNSDMSMSFD